MKFFPPSQRHFILGMAVALIALVLDQISKLWLVDHMELAKIENGIEILPFFKLVMVWNYGVSFGMFSAVGDDSRRWLLIAVAAVITAIMFVWLWKSHTKLLSLALGLVIGGAIGNVFDRLRWGAVADFFYLHYDEWYWPAFNIADSAIFIGVVLLCWDSIVNPEKTT
ncbi:MAG: signal peptidase II [Alphaproteobacteria bacterium]|nr:signal peptidase II [Alphaproteobacteria bacterium]